MYSQKVFVMNLVNIAIPVISHIVAALYLQKQKYNKFVTACFWGVYVILAVGMLVFVQDPPFTFAGLLLTQFVIFCVTTEGPLGEKLFLFLTYANSFSICIGINMILHSVLPRGVLQFLATTGVIVLMHLFVYKVLVFKYKAARRFFTAGWWKIIIVLLLFMIQFINQYAFNIVDKNSAIDLLVDFLIFSVIFNGTLIIIFDSVKSVSETNKTIYENNILKDIANTDALTNLQNRLAYVRFMEERASKQTEDAPSFVFTMLDIDNFKNINDTKGHAEGDRVLRIVGSTITEHFSKSGCSCFRIGGDEFVLLMENAQLSEAQEDLNALNQKLLKNNGITISYGCTEVDFGNKNPFETAYKKADAIMYQNKQQQKADAPL